MKPTPNFIRVFLFLVVLSAFLPACNLPAGPTSTPPVNATPAPDSKTSFPTPLPAIQSSPTPGQASASPVPQTPTQPSVTPGQPTLTPAATSVSSAVSSTVYGVILIDNKGSLNIRQKPGQENKQIGTLPYNATGIVLTGNETRVKEEHWVEIQRPGGNGWVNAFYLTQIISPSAFCSDPQVPALLGKFKDAILKKDGSLLGSLVGPIHGLSLFYLRGGTVANYTPEEASWVFSSTYQMRWGSAAGSGKEVVGSFSQVILPRLADVLSGNYTANCNQIKTGGASYPTNWPDEYRAINYYSLYRAGPAGNEMNWRTWVVGVEYIGNKPYLISLTHYEWEP